MGYAAGYYGYLWSLVYAQDVFTRFEREGLENPAVGGAYRREILETGSSREGDRLAAGVPRSGAERGCLPPLPRPCGCRRRTPRDLKGLPPVLNAGLDETGFADYPASTCDSSGEPPWPSPF